MNIILKSLVLLGLFGNQSAFAENLAIVTPSGTCFEAELTATIEGATDTDAVSAYLIVSGTADPNNWPQSKIALPTDGSWFSTINLGDDDQHFGTYIVQIAWSSSLTLKEGDAFGSLPDGFKVSAPILVKKAKAGGC